MHTLVTGATGLIGNVLVKQLLAEGHTVSALVRDPIKAGKLLPPEVHLLKGDISQEIDPALFKGMDWVFHAAGLPLHWVPDEKIYDEINHLGTRRVLEAAQRGGVKRVIHISTMEVFKSNADGVLNEGSIDSRPKLSAYDRSKQAAEEEAEKFLGQGVDIVFANPSAVYGPSPVNIALNSFFIKVLNHEVPMLPPGGTSVVFTEGLAKGLIRLAEHGKRGERYLFSDTHVSTRELAQATVKAGGSGKAPMVGPAWLIGPFCKLSDWVSRLTKKAPLVSSVQFDFLQTDAIVDSSKAIRELGFKITPLEQGIKKTVSALKSEGLLK